MQYWDQDQRAKIEISIPEQCLAVWENNKIISEYPISSAKNGLGYDEGSYKTPLGFFEIAETIGAYEPIGTIFQSRKPVGIWPKDEPEDASDLILSRILWLHGLEEKNINTYSRYIYLHGTNHEHLLGTAASQGCIRLGNRGIIDIFEKVTKKTQVKIVDSPLPR